MTTETWTDTVWIDTKNKCIRYEEWPDCEPVEWVTVEEMDYAKVQEYIMSLYDKIL